ncbi:MAG: exodeoxyribonuclease VII small subunit [Bacillota bacterium]
MEPQTQALTQEKPSFETNLQRLEEVVKLLESGDLSLERALTLFQEGITLARTLSGQLDAAEARIDQALKGAGGEPVLVPVVQRSDGE